MMGLGLGSKRSPIKLVGKEFLKEVIRGKPEWPSTAGDGTELGKSMYAWLEAGYLVANSARSRVSDEDLVACVVAEDQWRGVSWPLCNGLIVGS